MTTYASSQQLSSLAAKIILTVTVPRGEGQLEVTAPPASFNFLPAFHVHSADLHLSTVSTQGFIRVTANGNVADCIHVRDS